MMNHCIHPTVGPCAALALYRGRMVLNGGDALRNEKTLTGERENGVGVGEVKCQWGGD